VRNLLAYATGLWLVSSGLLFAGDRDGITHGPFIGHTTPTSASVWARCASAGEHVLVAFDPDAGSVHRAMAVADPESDLCVVFRLESLAVGRRYSYRIELPTGGTFTGDDLRFSTFKAVDQPSVVRLVFGSCARTDEPTAATWARIRERSPDAVVLLGDTPYIDSTKVDVLRAKHREFAAFEPMAAVLRSTAYYSVWDDHDFGKNDVDGKLPGKESSRRVFREYRANASCGDGETGVYSKLRIGAVEVFLIDTRYFAATEPSPVDPSMPTLLGKTQWEWLLRELRVSTASFKVLASGMIWNASTRPNKVDQWETYAHERDALFRYIGAHGITGVVLMGGDVHRSRALAHPVEELAGHRLLELITSPMHGSVIVPANAPHPALLHDAGVPSSFLEVEVDSTRSPARLVGRALDATGRELFAVCVEESGVVKSLRPRADLPPLLEFANGRRVESPEDWDERRVEIRELLETYFVGTWPREKPALSSSRVLGEKRAEDGSIRRRVELTFDTPKRCSFEVTVLVPSGDGPFPILLTQPRYYQIPWAEMALSRGYIVCLYPGVDSHHREKDFPGYDSVWSTFRAEYPTATWSEISTKAWLAGRALDYLLADGGGYAVAPGQVGIIGFSRYGKQSMIAAAFDERITSVVARSPGSPGSTPYRFTSRNTCAEAPADFPSEWFVPSLRSFTGREHELPIDSHGWLGLIAPRRCLIHTAHNDGSEPTFAVEQAYLEGRSVYRRLGKPENLRVLWRVGQHGPITQRQRTENLDWLDLSFGRGDARQDAFPEELLHAFDLETWKKTVPPSDLVSPFEGTAKDDDARRARIRWTLGESAPAAEPTERVFLTEEESAMMTHDRWAVPGTRRIPVSFGGGVRGNVYCPSSVPRPAAAVIWLHPLSYHSGYNEGYGVEGTTVYHRLAQAGHVVLAFDQCGFGLRLAEGRDFYVKKPRSSRLGRMVADVQAALDFLIDGKGAAAAEMPQVDPRRVYLLGFSVGGAVALHAAALDERVAGVASFSGFTPMRSDRAEEPTGGLRRMWQWHGLAPKLGLFDGRERALPYDYEDVLTLVAPRPCLVVTPKRDRDADLRDLRECLELARGAWRSGGAQKALVHEEPDDIGRFQRAQQERFLRWMKTLGQ